MTNAEQEAWFAGAAGRAVDIDGVGGFQCVDVPKDYGQQIFGVDWHALWPGAGNACDMINTYSPTYFDQILNDPANPGQIPQRGDIIVYAGNAANVDGHIGVVLAADSGGALLMDQDGNLQRPMAVERLGYDNQYTGPCSGWLRPKVSADAMVSTQSTDVTPLEEDVPLTQADADLVVNTLLNRALDRQGGPSGQVNLAAFLQWSDSNFQAIQDLIKGVPEAVVSHDFPWYGFDGNLPAAGRTTTNIKTDLGWADARATGIFNTTLAAVKGLAEQLKNAPDAEAAATTYEKLVELIDGTVIALNVQKPATTN